MVVPANPIPMPKSGSSTGQRSGHGTDAVRVSSRLIDNDDALRPLNDA
jgi:hypothetical protein